MNIETYQTPNESKRLAEELRRIADVPGDLIEVGVMWGGSAKIIRDIIPDKPLYLFDTFTGLPDKIDYSVDSKTYSVGSMAVNFEEVEEYFKNYKDVFIYKGVFPDKTGKIVKDKKFAFAHIDVDIYQSTKDTLKFLYPKVNSGGSIVIHDYPVHKGVKKAVDEFMKNKGDPMIEIGGEISRQLIIRK